MKNILAGLRAHLVSRKVVRARELRVWRGRVVTVRITLDRDHVVPLRLALARDCADLQWTIRVTPIQGTDRVRFVLYVSMPRAAMTGGLARVKRFLREDVYLPWLDAAEHRSVPGSALLGIQRPQFGSPPFAMPQPVGAQTIGDLLSDEHVLLGVEVVDRESLFARIAQWLEQRFGLPAADIKKELAGREALGSTGLGQGVAVPHVHLKALRQAVVLYARPIVPIPFDAHDGNPVTDFMVLFVPPRSDALHLRLLAETAERFCDHRFRERLHACRDSQAVREVFAHFNAMGAVDTQF